MEGVALQRAEPKGARSALKGGAKGPKGQKAFETYYQIKAFLIISNMIKKGFRRNCIV